MLNCFEQIKRDKLNIHILLTSRPSISEQVEVLKPSTIEISKPKLAADIERVIIANLKKLPRVKKFRKQVRTYILNKVKARADGMLLQPLVMACNFL